MKKYIPIIISIIAIAFLLAFVAGQGNAQQSNPENNRTTTSEAPTSSSNYIPIQGRLTDGSGNPLNGNYNVTFRLYDVYTGGTALCEETLLVTVNGGLFSHYFHGCSSALDGRQLYLGVEVESDAEMVPRQFIDNVPYAWTLRPGAEISGTMAGDALLDIDNYSSTGRGLRSEAQATSGVNYAVIGASRSVDGFGGYFYNNGGGVGLYASSTSGKGVSGYTSASSGTTYGVYGESNSPVGIGVYGLADTSGGVGVEGESEIGSGVYGNSTSGYGLYGHSSSSNAIYGDTSRVDNNYGVYTPDNLYSLNYHLSGAIMHVAKNGGGEPLEMGDVVVFNGVIAPTLANEVPMILVSKTSTAHSTAVAGVVYSRYSLDGNELDGAVAPGETLLLVVQGPTLVKVSASPETIQAGDLLSSSSQAGFASRSTMITLEGVPFAIPGTVFAKALESLNSGDRLIYAFVTLQ